MGDDGSRAAMRYFVFRSRGASVWGGAGLLLQQYKLTRRGLGAQVQPAGPAYTRTGQ